MNQLVTAGPCFIGSAYLLPASLHLARRFLAVLSHFVHISILLLRKLAANIPSPYLCLAANLTLKAQASNGSLVSHAVPRPWNTAPLSTRFRDTDKKLLASASGFLDPSTFGCILLRLLQIFDLGNNYVYVNQRPSCIASCSSFTHIYDHLQSVFTCRISPNTRFKG